MKIVVCIKQVPDTKGGVKFNPDGTLDRGAMLAIMNPDDKAGLEAALKLKDEFGAEVTVLTMGLPKAADALREALAMGADNAILVTDRVLGGADTWATSTTIAGALRNIDYDLIITGRQAIDGDTAQVGPEMAEHLGIPQITGALSLSYEDGKFVVVRENENYQLTLACAAPLLVTVTKSEKEPRFASIKGKMKARKAQIPTLTVADLDIDPATVGLKGSPTKVKKAFTPTPPEINGEIITEEDADAAVDMLFEKLVKAEVITR